MLDVGTGSGLLAIAAAKLGAGRVAANDNDPIAVAVARENAERNGTALELSGALVGEIGGTSDPRRREHPREHARWSLAPEIAARVAPGGAVLLAGSSCRRRTRSGPRTSRRGSARPRERRDGEWSLLTLERPRA